MAVYQQHTGNDMACGKTAFTITGSSPEMLHYLSAITAGNNKNAGNGTVNMEHCTSKHNGIYHIEAKPRNRHGSCPTFLIMSGA